MTGAAPLSPELAVLPPAAWSGALAAAVRAAGPAGPRAEALLAAFHERHLPLTPRLAAALAQLEQAARPRAVAPWGAAFDRAGEALGMAGELGQGPFWAAGLDVFPEAVAEPVLRRAARAGGRVVLFGAAALGAPVPDPEAEARALEARVAALLADPAAMGRGFWIEAGLALHGRAVQRLRARAAGRPLPPGGGLAVRPEPRLARLLFDLDPQFDPPGPRRRREPRPLARSETRRSGQRPKEGGVEGIRLTRQPEDFPDATLSELVLPPDLLMVKLLEEGYLMRHRPPLREPRRDLLVLGLADARAPGAAGPGAEGRALAKAAWADAALRLQLILARQGRTACDFAWAEAREGGLSAAALGPAPAVAAAVDPLRLAGGPRARLLMRSGLMPAFADAAPPVPHAPPPADAGPALERAAFAALAAPAAAAGAPGGARPAPRPGDHARVVAVACRARSDPEGRRAVEDPPAFRSAVLAGLSPEARAEAAVLGLIWPARVEPGAAFALLPAAGPAAEAAIAAEGEGEARAGLAAALGALSAFLIEAVLDALDAG